MIFFQPIIAISKNTFTELFRQRTLIVIALFGVVLFFAAFFWGAFTFGEQIHFLKNFGFGVMTFLGMIIALMAGSQALSSEVESSTIHTILSKPISREAFLLGKFLGVASFLWMTILWMGLLFLSFLFFKEHQILSIEFSKEPSFLETAQINKLHSQIWNQGLLQSFFLVGIKITLALSITFFISTFSTSTIFTVSASLGIYLAGHMEGMARTSLFENEGIGVQQLFLLIATTLLPDFGAFNIVDSLLAGHSAAWVNLTALLTYGLIYITVLIAASILSFRFREI